MGLSRSDALSIGRGVGAEAVQGVVLVSDTSPIEIIAGRTGQTLFLNHIEISWTDITSNGVLSLTDGSGGTAFWQVEFYSNPSYQPRAYSIQLGEYGFALTEGNGIFGSTESSNTDFTILALGCWR